MRKVVIVGGDLHNLGDLKLLKQSLFLMRGRHMLVRRWAPLPQPIERQVEDAGGTLVPGKKILTFARQCFGADMVIGGGQLVRGNTSIAALVGLFLATLMILLGGGRVRTQGLGVSRVNSAVRLILWRLILVSCGEVCVRDEASAQNISRILPRHRVVVTADMVFVPTPIRPSALPKANGVPLILVAPCIDAGEDRSIEGAALKTALETALSRLPGATVVIACHDPREAMDKLAAEQISGQNPEIPMQIFADYELDSLTALYQDASLVITNRLHSLIFSLLADVPVMAINDGSDKVAAISKAFSIPTLARQDETGAAHCVAEAFAFDRSDRAGIKARFENKALRNLPAADASYVYHAAHAAHAGHALAQAA
jgi:polysaccharide pyruvyl transferase WcaK-like protein